MNLPRSGVLVLGSNSIQSLLPATLSAQVESLLQNHRIPDAADLAEKKRVKLQGQRVVDDDERDELCYVYQCIGFQCLRETLFEDAGKNLFLGQLDPRVLISYFPELRGGLFSQDDQVDVFAGAAEYMPPEQSVDDIIATNLVMNYSPHIAPNTREAPVTAELRKVLRYAAEQMLEVFLRMHRFQSRTGVKGKGKSTPTSVAVDTVLAKIYAKNQKTKELHALIGEPNDIPVAEVEPVLLETAQYTALCRLYEREGNFDKLLEAWASLADGQWVEQDESAPKIDPVANIEKLVTERRDRALTARWGVWMSKRDPERGLRLIISRDAGRRGNKGAGDDEKAVLESLQQTSSAAATKFLQYLVLQRRTTDADLHMQLAVACVDNLLSTMQNEQTSKLWRAKLSSYTSNPPASTSFLSYFTSTTPDSEPKRIRLRAILFLQGSALYDAEAVRALLLGTDNPEETGAILGLEFAILEGKMGNHERALTLLANELRDAASAEAYCALGGAVVPARAAAALGDAHGLQAWAALLAPASGPGARGAPAISRQSTVDEGVRRALVKVLLGVYMNGGEANAERTARLLNSQAMNIDVLEVITLVPDDWPLSAMSSILARSFRRTLHAQHEGQLVKSIAMSENLKVAEETWSVIRAQGAIVEEADDSGDEKVYDEKTSTELDLVSPHPSGTQPEVHEVHPS